MPVEIRELIIRTEVRDTPSSRQSETLTKEEVNALKKSVLEACKSYVEGRLRDERMR